ncbi:MAG: NUDIX hydrolase [Phaeovulum sp.]|uniref:NUDIX hydrolase n=1 Tax=Phaeovulum sp. TaxID=2934796 RepID=UPI002734A4D3|nr:NUDIX hydrolase [Phaeovulum sp.]MDP3861964.1 NUDIX hydrolase [Phaeovulum sp.]
MIRRFGAPVLRGQSYSLRAGAYAVLLLGNRVLLTHQNAPQPEFQLPGGGIDAGESALRALRREVFEETGWGIAAPRRIGAFRRFAYMPEYDRWAEKLCTIYLARPTRRLGLPSEPGHRAVWMGAAEAAEALANEGDRHFLLRALAAR